ncbi:unnamed protein product [Brachionus calyciflorus]|uniref:Uncharacterized protein n=1 Tax=Brachionus calyciflorus TaxID=104777 RepID=A0A814K0T6_9BILA|nr:unnamed protein product [Brachionus calyciflorus]
MVLKHGVVVIIEKKKPKCFTKDDKVLSVNGTHLHPKVKSTTGSVKKLFENTINRKIGKNNIDCRECSEIYDDILFSGAYGKYTETTDGNSFLLYDPADEERIIDFASDDQLKILSSAKRWHGDGTFKASP